MPELPEVENIKLGLEKAQIPGQEIVKVVNFRLDVRVPIPMKELKKVEGHKINEIYRRAKYLVFKTLAGNILSHLGMTGSWRLVKEEETYLQQKHDHFLIELKNKQKLVYNDPRRFGLISFYNHNESPKEFADLAPEPLTEEFNVQDLAIKIKGKDVAIKVAIMDQSIVVGVGNIYASETLFMAGIKPTKKCKNIKKEELQKLVSAIKIILKKAIAAGGSTIRDYRNFSGEAGGFQQIHQVYNRERENCFKCKNPIIKKELGGRSTFWCPHCQR